MAINHVAAAARFVAELQPMTASSETLGELCDSNGGIWNCAHEGDEAITPLFRHRHRNAGLVNVEPDVQRLLHSPILRFSKRRVVIRAASPV
jgi:hypothetical protein